MDKISCTKYFSKLLFITQTGILYQYNVRILTCSFQLKVFFWNKIMNVAFCCCCFLSNYYNIFHDTVSVQETNFNASYFHIQAAKHNFNGKFMTINIVWTKTTISWGMRHFSWPIKFCISSTLIFQEPWKIWSISFMAEFHRVCSFTIIFMENSWPMKETTFTFMSHEKDIF